MSISTLDLFAGLCLALGSAGLRANDESLLPIHLGPSQITDFGLRRVSNDSPERSFAGHTDHVLAVAISPDSQRLLTGGIHQTVRQK